MDENESAARFEAEMRRARMFEHRGLVFPMPSPNAESDVRFAAAAYAALEALERRMATLIAEHARKTGVKAGFMSYQPPEAELARAVYALASCHTEDEQEAVNLLSMFLARNQDGPLPLARDIVRAERASDTSPALRRAWLGRWHALGYPAIRLEQERARALLHTENDAGLEVKAPWRAFIIRVPDGLLSSPRPEGRFITRVGVHARRAYGVEGTSWYASDHVGSYFELHEERLTDLLAPRKLTGFDDEHTALVLGVGRLVVGACIAAGATGALIQVKRPNVKWRLSKEPLTTEYILGPAN